jgi:5-methylcytosine-specific restriction enzyme A
MRREFPAKVKLAAWKRCGGNCEDCGFKIIGTPEYDHVRPDGLFGEPTLENCQVLCSKCHKLKTHGHDRPIMAKADRQMKSRAGIKRRGRRLPGNKDSQFKQKLDGTWVKRRER